MKGFFIVIMMLLLTMIFVESIFTLLDIHLFGEKANFYDLLIHNLKNLWRIYSFSTKI